MGIPNLGHIRVCREWWYICEEHLNKPIRVLWAPPGPTWRYCPVIPPSGPGPLWPWAWGLNPAIVEMWQPHSVLVVMMVPQVQKWHDFMVKSGDTIAASSVFEHEYVTHLLEILIQYVFFLLKRKKDGPQLLLWLTDHLLWPGTSVGCSDISPFYTYVWSRYD